MRGTQITNHGLRNGQMLRSIGLQSAGLKLELLNFGAATRDLRLVAGGADRSLVLGYRTVDDYLDNPAYLGVIAGRVANRIKNASFALNGEQIHLSANEGANQLHGGPKGLSHVLWEVLDAHADQACLRYISEAGENGFPGRAEITLRVVLEDMAVEYRLEAHVDRPTPISLAQHNYFNLGGGHDTIWDHRLQVDATGYLELDETHVPNGTICALDGTRYDLRRGDALGDLDPEAQGTDINLVFDPQRDPSLPVASLTAPDGLRMRVLSDQPGAQIYTGAHLPQRDAGLRCTSIGPFKGVCIEPQGFANAVNIADFPSVIVQPETPYRQVLRLEFGGI